MPPMPGAAALFSSSSSATRLSVVSTIADSDAFYYLDAPIKRVGALYCPVPFNPDLEKNVFPTPERIAAAVRETLA